MNFFAAQDQARRLSRRLVAAYVLATALIVAGVTGVFGFALYAFTDLGYTYTVSQFSRNNAGILVAAALLTMLFIVGASMFKTARLSSGGGAVARQMGGTQISQDIQDPLRRRLRNVVEEMAIASGVPVPEIYVLESESGINAFAAGFSPNDAAVAVTRGALELLDRDELQGVIAHEFSHILNGDMRLNIRLMGILFGIMVIGLIGRFIVRGTRHMSFASSRRNRSAPVVLIIGLGLAILGFIGMFFARAIKAGVSRQREYLADASAVQFTRQTDGIANALKKIGGYSHGSRIESADPEEVSHMLFGSGARFSGLFATHPPLVERIQALDPGFRASDFPEVDRRQVEIEQDDTGAASSAFAAAPASAGVTPESLAASVADTIGRPGEGHIRYAKELRASIPESLYSAAHSSDFAYLLTIALVLDRSGTIVERQLAIARDQLGTERANLLRRYYDELKAIGMEYRLPLLEIAFPALRQRPAEQLAYLLSMTTRMIETDGEIDLYEFCFSRILGSNLRESLEPAARRQHRRRGRRAELQSAAIALLRILADHGHKTDEAGRAAYEAGIGTLGNWAQDFEYTTENLHTISVLDHSLDVLQGLNTKGKESLLRAIAATASHDTRLTIAETELVRAVCATLDYPLPPILIKN